jgi:hypothetical protein
VKTAAVISLLIAALSAGPGGSEAAGAVPVEEAALAEREGIATGSSSLVVSVTGKDGTPIDGLAPGDFHLELDGERIEVLRAEQGPSLSVILLVEVSQRAIPEQEEIRQAADRFAAGLRQGDELGIQVFGASTAPLVPLSADLLETRRRLLSYSFQTVGEQRARLFDGMAAALESMDQAAGHRVLICYTIAFDWGSTVTRQEILETARQQGVSLEFVHHGRPPAWSGNYWRQRLDEMVTLARQTGGGLLRLREPGDIPLAYELLLAKLKGSYKLQFRTVPAKSRDGVQKVRVNVKRKKARVQAPTRYVDPRPSPLIGIR